jgi:hypothetical protein
LNVANDIQKKIQQSKVQTGKIQQESAGVSSDPDRHVFTAEQRRMLGQVYNLILSWRECKTTVEETASEAPIHPVIHVEVEA